MSSESTAGDSVSHASVPDASVSDAGQVGSPLRFPLATWAVLGVVAEGPTHGFAVAQLLAVEGPLGQVWTLPRPAVYRELNKLAKLDLVVERSTERSGRGPTRTILEATGEGHAAARRWLSEPVEHVREVRSALLLKLALGQRAGLDPHSLLRAQQRRLAPQLSSLLRARDQTAGFDRILAQWRLASSRAALEFLDAALRDIEVQGGAVRDTEVRGGEVADRLPVPDADSEAAEPRPGAGAGERAGE